MTLDVNTTKGLESLADERLAVAILGQNFPHLQYCDTPKAKPAVVDAVLIKAGSIYAVVETKCRPAVTLAKLQGEWKNQWLVTFEKIIAGAKIAEALQVPFFGFLFLPAEKALLVQQIWNPEAGFAAEMNIKRTITQATTNGGSIERSNAYIDMGAARIYRSPE